MCVWSSECVCRVARRGDERVLVEQDLPLDDAVLEHDVTDRPAAEGGRHGGGVPPKTPHVQEGVEGDGDEEEVERDRVEGADAMLHAVLDVLDGKGPI